MKSEGREDILAQAELVVLVLTGQWHAPAPGTRTSACSIVQPMLPSRVSIPTEPSSAGKPGKRDPHTRAMTWADRDTVRCPKVTKENDDPAQ